MLYCSVGDEKATVSWSWDGGKTYKHYISRVVPVNVTADAAMVDGTGSTGVWSIITYDHVTASSPFVYTGDITDSPIFNDRTITSAKDGRVLYSDDSHSAGSIQIRNLKFTPTPVSGYKILIASASGSKLYEDKKASQFPPIFEVACGNGCPEGSHKCTHKGYPGYCCVPCKKTGDRLKNIANKVGR